MFDAESELDVETFVDDPILTLSGTDQERSDNAALWIFAIRCLGFPLAFKKGQRGPGVTWIGAVLTDCSSSVVVTIKPEILNELRNQIQQIITFLTTA